MVIADEEQKLVNFYILTLSSVERLVVSLVVLYHWLMNHDRYAIPGNGQSKVFKSAG